MCVCSPDASALDSTGRVVNFPSVPTVTSGMLSQRERLMNVVKENTSLMNSVAQLAPLIFLWRCTVKWSHG